MPCDNLWTGQLTSKYYMDQSKAKSTVLICEKTYVIEIVILKNYCEYTPNSLNGIDYLSQYYGDTE